MHKIILLQVLSGVMVALGQPAFFPALGLLASIMGFSLFWKSLDLMNSNKSFKVSFIWFFLVQLIQLSWLVSLEYQGFYILILYVFLSAGMALQFACLTFILWKSFRLESPTLLAIAALWTLFEWSRFYVVCGFAFNCIGVLLSGSYIPLQMASLFGVLGMSFWVMFTNLLGFKMLRFFSKANLWKWIIVFTIPYLYGFLHVTYHDSIQSKEKEYSVLLIHPSLTPSQKDLLRDREDEFILPLKQWERILKWVSQEKYGSLDLIVLPEAVVPFGFDQYIYRKEEVHSIFFQYFGEAVKNSFPRGKEPFGFLGNVSNAYILQTISNFFSSVVLAGLDYEDENGLFYNSMFCFQKGEFSPVRYDKRVLLPLAEYMPFTFLQSLSDYYGISNFFTKGKSSKIFSGKMSISPSICYEELFPMLVREGRKKGANLFVNITNDGWYPFSKLSEQHFTQGLIRSVENGVPLVRSCNIGVTAAVDSLGRSIAAFSEKEGGFLFVKVPSYHYKTVFLFVGEKGLVVICCVFMGIGFFAFFIRTSLSLTDRSKIDLDENGENSR